MEKYNRISVTSEHSDKLQTLKDSLTATEKKIILEMLNNEMTSGQVRNKIFNIKQTEQQKAVVKITKIVFCELLQKKEFINQTVQIFYS